MADNYNYNINSLIGKVNQARKSGPTLPSPGNVVMASVDEDNGDGTYTLKWGTNRLTVASKTPLNKGETLILKSEQSPEGKPILVVQGNALPSSRDAVPGLATYKPPTPTGSDAAGTSIAASATPVDVPRPTPAGTTLLPILAELPDVEVVTLELLLSAEEERQKSTEEAKQAEAEEEQQQNRQNITKDGEKSPVRQGTTPDSQPQTREQTVRPPQGAEPGANQPQATENQPKQPTGANQTSTGNRQPAQSTSTGNPAVVVEAIADAIEQIANSSRIPLSQDLSHVASSKTKAAVVPEAIADRAATILLNAAGLTPSPAALEAAKALISHNVQVDRSTVQTLMSMVAGLEGDERGNLLNAAARLASHDVPLATPLASGLADILARESGISELLSRITTLLDPEGLPENATQLLTTAREMLEMLVVDLDKADAPLALERFISTFGREALGKTLAMVETAAQAYLEANPQLATMDAAMTAILTMLEQGETPTAQPGQTTPAATLPSADLPEVLQPPATGQTANPEQSATPNAQTEQAKTAQEAPLPGSKELLLAQENATAKNQQLATELAKNPLFTGKSAFQLPGANSAEIELLRPSGALDRILASAEQQQGVATTKDTVEKLLRELLGPDSHKAESALRDLSGRGKQALAHSASRLAEMERDLMRNDPVLTRLSDAAGTIRDLGRQLLAAKAENLATSDRNPGVMMAEVPFKLNEDGGNGRMQMFYRRTKSAKGGWSARVILDLNTTNMGPVLGDMRFFGQDMVLNLFVDKKETAEYLAGSAEELTEALLGKGFRLKPKFMILPPPPLPEIPAAEKQTAIPVRAEQKEPEKATISQDKATGQKRRIDAKA